MREEGRLEGKQCILAGINECTEREGEGGAAQSFSQLPYRWNKMSSAPQYQMVSICSCVRGSWFCLGWGLVRMCFITAALVRNNNNNNSFKNLLKLCYALNRKHMARGKTPFTEKPT